VEVRYDEEAANHIGPEICVDVREDICEALSGEQIGQPLSRESDVVSGADAVSRAEGNIAGCAFASAPWARRGRRTWHVWTLFAREPGDLPPGHLHTEMVRIGKARSRSR
jgi:hypothetical protein